MVPPVAVSPLIKVRVSTYVVEIAILGFVTLVVVDNCMEHDPWLLIS